MNTHPSVQDLEALLRGTLDADQTLEVSAHAEGCALCSREMAWLRAEQDLFAQRARGVPPSQVWEQIEQQIAARVSRKESAPRGWRRIVSQTFQDQKAQWFAVGAAALAIVGLVAASPLSPLHKGRWISSHVSTQVDPRPASSDGSATADADSEEDDSDSHEAEVAVSTQVRGPITLDLSTNSADVEVIKGVDSEAKLTVTESSLKVARFIAPASGQSIWRIEFDGITSLQEGHLRLQVPEGSKLKIATASGDIRVVGVKGDVTVSSSSGDVSLQDAQAVTVDVTSGDVQLQNIAGTVDAKTISGELSISGEVTHPVHFRSVSGDLTLTGSCRVATCKVSAETTSGNVSIHGGKDNSFVGRLGSVSGEISGAEGLPIEMKRRPGHKTEWSTKVGSGAGSVELQTMSGDLMLATQ